MKTIELKEGDSINIPEGCVPVIKDNVIVFEKNFEDGDILTSMFTNDIVFIFRENKSDPEDYRNHYYVCFSGGRINVASEDSMYYCGVKQNVRHATEGEKQFLFNKMQEEGLKWNEKEKQVERNRWRAEEGEIYYYVSSEMDVTTTCSPKKGEYLYNYDGNSFLSYNYFRTIEQATEAARRMKEALIQYHEELGE